MIFNDSDFDKNDIIICKVKKQYLKYIRRFDNRIPVKANREFIGLIILINNMQYVVPLTSQSVIERTEKGKQKRSPIITTNIKNVADVLHNNMFPIPFNEIENTPNISYENNPYLNYEYRYIRKKWKQINMKSMYVYIDRYNENSKDYNFLKYICCDFKKLEILCKQWSNDHLLLSLKDQYLSEEIIYIDKNVDFKQLVITSDYVVNFEVKEFNLSNTEVQNVTLSVFDEFNQEKSITICVKIKDESTPDNNVEKEVVGVS